MTSVTLFKDFLKNCAPDRRIILQTNTNLDIQEPLNFCGNFATLAKYKIYTQCNVLNVEYDNISDALLVTIDTNLIGYEWVNVLRPLNIVGTVKVFFGDGVLSESCSSMYNNLEFILECSPIKDIILTKINYDNVTEKYLMTFMG